jgi:hypothetical protein
MEQGPETDTGSVIADGSLFAIRRSPQAGPQGIVRRYIRLAECIKLQGRRVVRAPDLRGFQTHTTKAEDEFRRKVRIACECMHVHFTLWPELCRLDMEFLQVCRAPFAALDRGYLLLLGALLATTAIWTAVGPFWALSLPLAMSLAVWISMLASSARLNTLEYHAFRWDCNRRVARSARPARYNLGCSGFCT